MLQYEFLDSRNKHYHHHHYTRVQFRFRIVANILSKTFILDMPVLTKWKKKSFFSLFLLRVDSFPIHFPLFTLPQLGSPRSLGEGSAKGIAFPAEIRGCTSAFKPTQRQMCEPAISGIAGKCSLCVPSGYTFGRSYRALYPIVFSEFDYRRLSAIRKVAQRPSDLLTALK